MINHRLFKKETIAHGLLNSSTYPNILIPIKLMVKDINYDHNNPRYIIKILKFYDNIHFLKRYFYKSRFKQKITSSGQINPFSLKLKPEHFKNKQTLLNELNRLEEKAYVVIDSVMVKLQKKEIFELFNKLQDYLIAKKLREWRELSIRNIYEGRFSVSDNTEWEKRFRKSMMDKLQETCSDPEDIVQNLLFHERFKERYTRFDGDK